MTRVPRLPNSVGDLLRWARDVNDFIGEIDPGTGSPNTLVSRTTRGFQRSALPTDDGSGGDGTMPFKGDWADGTYSQGDIVIRRTAVPNGDFDKALEGTYYALEDIVHGDLPPAESAGAGATLTVVVTSGAVTAVNVSVDSTSFNPYPANSFVQFTGDGTGASAHAIFDGNGKPTSIVVDSGGTGYTQAKTTAILMNFGQHWDDFAQFRTKKWTLLNGKQRITIDTGRDDPATPPVGTGFRILIEKDYTDTTSSATRAAIDISQLLSILGAGSRQIQFYELATCEDGAAYHRIFWCSDKY